MSSSRSTTTTTTTTAAVVVATAAAALVATTVLLYQTKKKRTSSPVSVSSLCLYPIKSCSEISVTSATTTPRGFLHDRVLQVINEKGMYCTPREKEYVQLFHVQPTLLRIDESSSSSKEDDDSNNTTETILTLTAPAAKVPLKIDINHKKKTRPIISAQAMGNVPVSLEDYGDEVAKWIQDATGIPGIRLAGIGGGDGDDDTTKTFTRTMQVNEDQGEPLPSPPSSTSSSSFPVSLADEAPYLLTTEASLTDLNQRGKSPIDMRRFRPNLVLRGGTSMLRPWEEDTWKKIRIGPTAEFWVWQRCGRCIMTTIDRDDPTKRGPEPLATLSTFRERAHGQRNFGVHLIPVVNDGSDSDSNGIEIHLGDTIEVLEYDPERLAEWQQLYR